MRAELTIRPDGIDDRRIVVAEDAQLGALGVASMEGTTRQGSVGLCFVEPGAIGRGVGRALYFRVMRAARELGFTRITIDSDLNAEPSTAGWAPDPSDEPPPARSRGIADGRRHPPRDWRAGGVGQRPPRHVKR